MRTLNFCRLNNESSNEIPNEKCIHNKSCICDIDGNKCTNTRYVRADVAIRYAMMMKRKGYDMCLDGCVGNAYIDFEAIPTYEEASQKDGAK